MTDNIVAWMEPDSGTVFATLADVAEFYQLDEGEGFSLVPLYDNHPEILFEFKNGALQPQQPQQPQQPPADTIRVRIAVVVNANGEWAAVGCSEFGVAAATVEALALMPERIADVVRIVAAEVPAISAPEVRGRVE